MTMQRDWSTGLAAGSTGIAFISYNGTTKSAGKFDGGTTAPTNTSRLNYDGNFYATTFYGSGAGISNNTIPVASHSQNTARLLGRTTAGVGSTEEISVGTSLSLSAGSLAVNTLAASVLTSGTVATARLGSGTANSGTYLRGDQTWAAAGKLLQHVYTGYSEVATGTGLIPHDDTVPQNTEGTQFMTIAITPTSASSKLRVRIVAMLSANSDFAADGVAMALFINSNVSASAVSNVSGTNLTAQTGVLEYIYSPGTTATQTFYMRAGAHSTATTTLNGSNGLRLFGGIFNSSIQVEEIA